MNLLKRWNMPAVVAIALACHLAIGADAPQHPGARADGSATPDAPRPASEWYQTPADARYDAANPVLPSDYPARRYSEADLIRSLVALAEKDGLSSADVEHEFGMRFVDGFARGQPPLGTRLSSASGSRVLRSLNLSFVNRQTRSEFIEGAPRRRVTCINAAALARAFRASGWRLAVVRRYGHSGGDEHTLAKTVAGTERRIVIDPFPHDDDASRSGACVDFVHHLFVGNGPAAADTPLSVHSSALSTDGRVSVSCPQVWRQDIKAYDAVIRTTEYKSLAKSLDRRRRIRLMGPDKGERLQDIDGICMAVIGVYVDHPERLEMRMVFGVDPRSYSVYVQDPVTGDFHPTFTGYSLKLRYSYPRVLLPYWADIQSHVLSPFHSL
jgi:hypothetical protein